jgi:hypothetical protein
MLRGPTGLDRSPYRQSLPLSCSGPESVPAAVAFFSYSRQSWEVPLVVARQSPESRLEGPIWTQLLISL